MFPTTGNTVVDEKPPVTPQIWNTLKRMPKSSLSGFKAGRREERSPWNFIPPNVKPFVRPPEFYRIAEEKEIAKQVKSCINFIISQIENDEEKPQVESRSRPKSFGPRKKYLTIRRTLRGNRKRRNTETPKCPPLECPFEDFSCPRRFRKSMFDHLRESHSYDEENIQVYRMANDISVVTPAEVKKEREKARGNREVQCPKCELVHKHKHIGKLLSHLVAEHNYTEEDVITFKNILGIKTLQRDSKRFPLNTPAPSTSQSEDTPGRVFICPRCSRNFDRQTPLCYKYFRAHLLHRHYMRKEEADEICLQQRHNVGCIRLQPPGVPSDPKYTTCPHCPHTVLNCRRPSLYRHMRRRHKYTLDDIRKYRDENRHMFKRFHKMRDKKEDEETTAKDNPTTTAVDNPMLSEEPPMTSDYGQDEWNEPPSEGFDQSQYEESPSPVKKPRTTITMQPIPVVDDSQTPERPVYNFALLDNLQAIQRRFCEATSRLYMNRGDPVAQRALQVICDEVDITLNTFMPEFEEDQVTFEPVVRVERRPVRPILVPTKQPKTRFAQNSNHR